MIDHLTSVTNRMLRLRGMFAHHPKFSELCTEFERLLTIRRAEISIGVSHDAQSILLIGASGSGKSTMIARMLKTNPSLVRDDNEHGYCDVISLMVPSPATLKSVGRAILEALGYPLKRERTADAIWELVRMILRERRVLFLHLDEAQDIASHQTAREMQAVINTLKTLAQNKAWPVGLILSGMPILRDTFNFDVQLGRRAVPIEISRLSPSADLQTVASLIDFYAKAAEVRGPVDPERDELAVRLIYAADREFGLVIQITIEALYVALKGRSDVLTVEHFAAAFARRSACIPGLNPFLADEYDRLKVRKLLMREGDT